VAKQNADKAPAKQPEEKQQTPVEAAADVPAEESPEVKTAAAAVARAKDELKKAQQLYEKTRDEATEKLKKARSATLGDVIDGTLEMVKKHPGPGVIVAIVVGFFLGRLFRR